MFVSKSLNVFIALAEEGSYKKAAERLYLTATPLFRMIKKIEEDVGMKLFINTRNGLSLSQDGIDFYKKISPLFYEMNEISKDKNSKQINIYTNNPQYGVLNDIRGFFEKTGGVVSIVTESAPSKMYDIYISNSEIELLHASEDISISEEIRLWVAEGYVLDDKLNHLVQSSFFSSTKEFSIQRELLNTLGIKCNLLINDLIKCRLDMVEKGNAITLASDYDMFQSIRCKGLKIHRYNDIVFPSKKKIYIRKQSGKFCSRNFTDLILKLSNYK